MINIKDKFYSKLLEVNDNVSDVYPNDWARMPAIQYTEEENSVYEKTDKEEKSYVRFRIDIWDNKSISEIAIKIDEKISELGLVRTGCSDISEQSGMRHKQMRYEGIIDIDTEMVYWNGGR